MGASNLDHFIISYPCKSSSSSTQEAQTINLVSGGLKIQVPSAVEDFKVGNQENNPMTPRSVEHKIPVTGACPPAPRRAKRVRTTGKQRASCFPVVRGPTDFMVYLDAMLAFNETVYVPDIVVGDLLDAGDHVKWLKLLRQPAHEP